MCGLFGGIGNSINPSIIRALAIANRSRGTDALGFFNSKNDILKGAGDPMRSLQSKATTLWLEESSKSCWFISGHTRMGTRGLKTIDANSHPFQYGDYIGSHNGVVHAPMTYTVDSQWLIDLLHQNKGDYLTAFKEVTGSWALTWTDKKRLFLQSCGNPLAAVLVGENVYYSSDEEHLFAAVGHVKEYWEFKEGETWVYYPRVGKTPDVRVLKKFPYKPFKYVPGQYLGGGSSNYRQPYDWEGRNGTNSCSPTGPGCSTPGSVSGSTGSSSGGTTTATLEGGLTMSKKEAKRLRKAAKKRGLSLCGPEEEALWAQVEILEAEEAAMLQLDPPGARSEDGDSGTLIL